MSHKCKVYLGVFAHRFIFTVVVFAHRCKGYFVVFAHRCKVYLGVCFVVWMFGLVCMAVVWGGCWMCEDVGGCGWITKQARGGERNRERDGERER